MNPVSSSAVSADFRNLFGNGQAPHNNKINRNPPYQEIFRQLMNPAQQGLPAQGAPGNSATQQIAAQIGGGLNAFA